jgi:hypothetical protein
VRDLKRACTVPARNLKRVTAPCETKVDCVFVLVTCYRDNSQVENWLEARTTNKAPHTRGDVGMAGQLSRLEQVVDRDS